MTPDYTALRFWLELLLLISNCGLWVYAGLDRKQRATAADLKRHQEDEEKRFDLVENQLTALDRDLKAAPTHHDLGKIYESIKGVGKSVDTLSGTMAAQTRTLDLITQHLLTKP